MFKRLFTVFAALTVGALFLTGCAPTQQSLTLIQSANEFHLDSLDLNPAGDAGDLSTFEAPLQKDGKPFGSFVGTVIKISGLDQGSNPNREERLVTMVFDLPDGQISALGVTYFERGKSLIGVTEPMTRAIVGGTGAYVGIKGEAILTRNADNSATHVLHFWK